MQQEERTRCGKVAGEMPHRTVFSGRSDHQVVEPISIDVPARKSPAEQVVVVVAVAGSAAVIEPVVLVGELSPLAQIVVWDTAPSRPVVAPSKRTIR